jgi:hypothetical protein
MLLGGDRFCVMRGKQEEAAPPSKDTIPPFEEWVLTSIVDRDQHSKHTVRWSAWASISAENDHLPAVKQPAPFQLRNKITHGMSAETNCDLIYVHQRAVQRRISVYYRRHRKDSLAPMHCTLREDFLKCY